MIPAADRLALLTRVGSEELSPRLRRVEESGGTVPEGEFDPIFWDQALGLARLELGLLRIAGAEVNDLRVAFERALASREGDQARRSTTSTRSRPGSVRSATR